jgi:hypothetical protein
MKVHVKIDGEEFFIVYYFCHLVFGIVSYFGFRASNLILVKNPVFYVMIYL